MIKNLPVLLLIIMLIGGCGDNNEPSNTGSISFQIEWQEQDKSNQNIKFSNKKFAAPASVVTIVFIVTGPGMSEMIKSFDASLGQGTIDGVPVGSGRTLTIEGKAISGIVFYKAVKTGITVNKGQNTAMGIVTMKTVTEWQKMFGGSKSDYVYSIQQTSDGGYIIAGWSYSTDISGATNNGDGDYYIIKLDSTGNIEWQKMFGGSEYDVAESIQQTNDGGYIIAGCSYSTDINGLTNNGGENCYIIKLDSTGNTQWQKMFGGSSTDGASSIQQTSDGGYIIAGRSNSIDIGGLINNGKVDYYIIKLDSTGNIQWQKMFGGSDYDEASSIQQTSDGGYIIAGRSNSIDINGAINNGDWDCYIIKLDSTGNIQWQKMFGGSDYDEASSIQQTSDGGYIIAGCSKSTYINGSINNGSRDCYIIKLDSTGDTQWQKMFGGSERDYASSIQQTSDGGYIIAGFSKSTYINGSINNGDWDCYIIKLNSTGDIQWQKMFGGSESDYARSIQQTNDGGYIIAGYSNNTDITGVTNHGDYDCYIIKLYSE